MPAGDRKHPYRVGAPAPARSSGQWFYALVPLILLAAIGAALFLF